MSEVELRRHSILGSKPDQVHSVYPSMDNVHGMYPTPASKGTDLRIIQRECSMLKGVLEEYTSGYHRKPLDYAFS